MITRKQLAEYIQSLPSSRKEIVQEIAIPMMNYIEELEKEIDEDEVVHTSTAFENVGLRDRVEAQARTIAALEAEQKKILYNREQEEAQVDREFCEAFNCCKHCVHKRLLSHAKDGMIWCSLDGKEYTPYYDCDNFKIKEKQ